MTPPAPDESLMANPAMTWNFNFRKYSPGSAETLWTDPSFQRDVSEGKQTAGARPTALSVTCDDDGFALFVFSGEPDLAAALDSGRDAPSSVLECYIVPRDADNEKIEHYYQFIIDQKSNTIRDFPWLIDGRGFQSMAGRFRPETRLLRNGYLTKLAFPWHFLWDRLPFLTQDDNLWRLGVMRWCPGGGQTWGGIVHEVSRMGCINWPEFTPQRRTAVMKRILRHAWTHYHSLKPDLAPAFFPPDTSPYRKELPRDAHSWNFIPQYQDFCGEVLNAMVAERDALGKTISAFETLPLKEQEAFYRENAGKLMNFEHDVRRAFRLWLEEKITLGEIAK